MTTTIGTHCETALDSPYSRDRQSAIRELGRVYPGADPADRDRILETLRQVAFEGSARDDRKLAREMLLDCFETDPADAAPVLVDTFRELAEKARLSDERLEAIDSLRKCYPKVDERHRSAIGSTLADIAGNATYEDERKRAQRRLSDVSQHEREETTAPGSAESAGYLGQLLADHLKTAARDGPEACRQRAEEVSEFLVEHPVDDDAYDDLVADAESLVEQLAVAPTDGALDEDRIRRVEGIAARMERLYARN